MTLGDGLDEIGVQEFRYCFSLRRIVMHNAGKTNKDWAYGNCSRLTTVTLGDGVEKIGMSAFESCYSLKRIIMPPAVKAIDASAFKNCSNLTNVEFCDEIEEIVSCKAMLDLWNQGVHEKYLSTYSFLVRCSIPDRVLGLLWYAAGRPISGIC